MICRFEREDDHIPNCSLDGVRGINETGSTTDGDLLEVSTRLFLIPKDSHYVLLWLRMCPKHP
jgi:hypothetical protein